MRNGDAGPHQIKIGEFTFEEAQPPAAMCYNELRTPVGGATGGGGGERLEHNDELLEALDGPTRASSTAISR